MWELNEQLATKPQRQALYKFGDTPDLVRSLSIETADQRIKWHIARTKRVPTSHNVFHFMGAFQ